MFMCWTRNHNIVICSFKNESNQIAIDFVYNTVYLKFIKISQNKMHAPYLINKHIVSWDLVFIKAVWSSFENNVDWSISAGFWQSHMIRIYTFYVHTMKPYD